MCDGLQWTSVCPDSGQKTQQNEKWWNKWKYELTEEMNGAKSILSNCECVSLSLSLCCIGFSIARTGSVFNCPPDLAIGLHSKYMPIAPFRRMFLENGIFSVHHVCALGFIYILSFSVFGWTRHSEPFRKCRFERPVYIALRWARMERVQERKPGKAVKTTSLPNENPDARNHK